MYCVLMFIHIFSLFVTEHKHMPKWCSSAPPLWKIKLFLQAEGINLSSDFLIWWVSPSWKDWENFQRWAGYILIRCPICHTSYFLALFEVGEKELYSQLLLNVEHCGAVTNSLIWSIICWFPPLTFMFLLSFMLKVWPLPFLFDFICGHGLVYLF